MESKYTLRQAVRTIGYGLFAVVGWPFVFFAVRGLRGELSDAGHAESVRLGLWCLAVAIVTLLPALLTFLPTGSRGVRYRREQSGE